MAHCSAQAVNTICFEGCAHVHLNDFGVALRWHLGSLLDTLAIQSRNLSVKGGTQKAFAKKRRKHKLRHSPGLAVWVPKKGKMSTESKARARKQEVRDGSDTPDVPTARWRIYIYIYIYMKISVYRTFCISFAAQGHRQ